MIPGKADGRITLIIVSDFVAPSAKEPSLRLWGTAVITSSDKDETKGIIITPITTPAARALSEETSKPKVFPSTTILGATTNAAKKP